MLQRIKKQKPIFIDELFGLPAGYENDIELMWYDPDDFDLNEPNDDVFNNVLLMNCTAS